MFKWLVLCSLLLVGCTAASPVDQAMAPLYDQVEAEQKKLAALPSDASLDTRFASVFVLDQAPRKFLSNADHSALSNEVRAQVFGRTSNLMRDLDQKNLAVVLKHLPPEGWYLKHKHGEDVATTAFLVIQHSDLENWRRFLPVIEPFVATGEVAGPAYGMMYDRLALAEGRPQRYGTQMGCINAEWQVQNLEAPDTVDQRRRDLGFNKTLAEYEARFASQPCL